MWPERDLHLQSFLMRLLHVLLFRRPLFSVMDAMFCESKGQTFGSEPKRILSCLSCTAVSDLRAAYHEELVSLDASPWAGAVCSTQVGSAAEVELWHAELQGYYTKLAPASSAVFPA